MDSEYLKKHVGEILAKGISEVVFARPADPVEYLALWMLRQLQLQDVEARREQIREEIEKQRKVREEKSKQERDAAALKIQEEMRLFIERQREQERKEQELAAEFQRQQQQIEQAIAEEVVEVDPTGKEAEVVAAETEKIRSDKKYRAALEALMKLDKDKIAQLKSYKKPPPAVVPVLRSVLLILDHKYTTVKTWTDIRAKITNASEFLKAILAYDPTQKQKIDKFKRIKRSLKKVTSDSAAKSSLAILLLYQWLLNAIDLREKTVAERKARKDDTEDLEAAEAEEADADQGDESDADDAADE